MWFGPCYRDFFGDERLLGTPAYSVEQIGNGIYVQLTEQITDTDKNRDAYLAAQAATQDHLGRDAFVGTAEGRCRVPEFVVPNP